MQNQLKQSEEFRKLSETVLLKQSSANITHPTSEEIQKTIHNLRVHQLELEMQKEELHRTQAELDVSRAHHFDFNSLAPVAYSFCFRRRIQ